MQLRLHNLGGFYQHFTMSVTGTTFDSIRVVGAGGDNEGTFFAVVDNVTWNAVPEPGTMITLTLGLLSVIVRRHRSV